MAGVASMAVAINPADKSLIVVIELLPFGCSEPKTFGFSSWNEGPGFVQNMAAKRHFLN
jgi:hypothetical protein